MDLLRNCARCGMLAPVMAIGDGALGTRRFKVLVGLPPLDYLARWRIHAARQALRHTDRIVGAIAAEFGYSSDSASSRTCKRVTGLSPAQHRPGA